MSNSIIKIFNKIHKLFFSNKGLIFITLLFFYIYNLYYSYNAIIVSKNPWILGDWLINYLDGGFKRRGLMGTIFISIYDFFKIDLRLQVFLFVTILYTFLFYYLFKIIEKNTNHISMFFLLISPLGFQMFLVFSGVIARKEIYLFTVFAYFLYQLKKDEISIFKLFLFTFLGILIHELIVFYILYFYFAIILRYGKNFKLKYLIPVLPFMVITLYLMFYGNDINSGKTYEILKNRNLIIGKGGILDYDKNFDTLHFYLENIKFYSLYLVSILLGVFSIYTYMKNHTCSNQFKALFSYGVITLFFISLPIFYLAIDWGRWINIHFVLISMLLFTFINKENGKFNYLMLLLIPTQFIWGMNHYYLGFHIATKLSLFLIELKHSLF